MLQFLSFRSVALAACGLLLAVPASALTLGRASGAVLIGRPLELAIPATLDGAGSEPPCLAGELFHGDTRVVPAPRIEWVPGAGEQGTVRVRSSQLVDEPMVTLYLRVGCAQQMTRRYVLLSELPPVDGPAASGAPAAASAQPARAQAAAAAGRPSAQPPDSALVYVAPQSVTELPPAAGQAPTGAPAAAASAAARRPASAPASAAPQARATPASPAAPAQAQLRPAARPNAAAAAARPPRRASAPAQPAAGGGRPRLQLEPVDLSLPEDPVLRLTSELRVPTEEADVQARAAATALWQALNRTPEEAAQEALRIQALEREIAGLRNVTRQNAAAVAQMREQLEQARRDRADLVLLGGVLLALLLAGAGLLAWSRRRAQRDQRQTAWYEAGGVLTQHSVPDLPESGPAPLSRPNELLSKLWPRRGQSAADSAAGPLEEPKAAIESTPAPLRAAAPVTEFGASQGGSLRMVRVDELIDIQDKADFFLSLGQHDKAIAVLESHVHDQVETSPLPWLDLLELYHELGRREDYERLRAEFRQHFAAVVPEFDQFRQSDGGLEDYSKALSRIVALWPSRRVLEVIEESIFRKPSAGGRDTFSLPAYRELILLYNIAREVVPQEDGMDSSRNSQFDPPTNFPSTDLQSLAVLDGGAEPLVFEPPAPSAPPERERLMVPPPSPRLGLDIDLSEPEPAQPTLALVPKGKEPLLAPARTAPPLPQLPAGLSLAPLSPAPVSPAPTPTPAPLPPTAFILASEPEPLPPAAFALASDPEPAGSADAPAEQLMPDLFLDFDTSAGGLSTPPEPPEGDKK